jgi:hypothetical protein
VLQWTSGSPIAIGLTEFIGQKGQFSLFFFVFSHIFAVLTSLFANFRENSRVVGVNSHCFSHPPLLLFASLLLLASLLSRACLLLAVLLLLASLS